LAWRESMDAEDGVPAELKINIFSFGQIGSEGRAG
jgi:hypothetical protein